MKNNTLKTVCECAVFTALAYALSFLKIPIGVSFGGFGGSIDLVMIPLILCAIRWGVGWGLGVGLIFGTAKFFFAGGSAVNWQSMLLDYSIAYMMVGLAGIFCRRSKTAWAAALVGCTGRFIIHFISGITIYATAGANIMGLQKTNAWVYSLLYNSTYMLPNTVIAVTACLLLAKPLEKYLNAKDLSQ